MNFFFFTSTDQALLVNLLGTFGNFETDTNSDGVADGFAVDRVASKSTANNIQTFTPSIQFGTLYRSVPATYLNKYYACVYIDCPRFPIRFQVEDNPQYTTASSTSASTTGYEFLSIYFTKNTNDSTFTARVVDENASGFSPINVKQMCFVDLTACFGAGKEPSKAWMDDYIRANPYFISKWITNNR